MQEIKQRIEALRSYITSYGDDVFSDRKDALKNLDDLEAALTPTDDIKRIADKTAKEILADITDRSGWRQEWDGFDADVKREIKKEHKDIILKALMRVQRVEQLSAAAPKPEDAE